MHMTFASIATMFVAMMALAIVPDSSAFAVIARSLASGFKQGVVTVMGILVGDYVFIMLAVFGLGLIAESPLFVVVKYLGGPYLIWLGIDLWRTRSSFHEIEELKVGAVLDN